MNLTVADYICACLCASGVKTIYGYPGAAIIPFMESIHQKQDMDWILTRHEAAAALCASAQAKYNNQLAVCAATTGPGASNLITGLLDAEMDRAPVLAITGLLPTWKSDLPHFQHIQQANLLDQVCGLSLECKHPAQIPFLLRSAIGYALKKRAVAHLAIPVDIQKHALRESDFKFDDLPSHHPVNMVPPPDSVFANVAQLINQHANTVIVAGHRAFEAGTSIEALAKKIQAPVITTFSAKGSIDESLDNYFGVLGLYGAPTNAKAYAAIEDATLIVAFGVADILPFITREDGQQHRQLIQCEPDASFIDHQYIQHKILLGPLDKTAQKLNDNCDHQSHVAFLNHATTQAMQHTTQAALQPQNGFIRQDVFMHALNHHIDRKNVTLAIDTGDIAIWALHHLQLKQHQRVLISHLLGAMGFCLPALIATKLTHTEQLVVGICGDGGFQMTMNELNTAIQQQLNIVLIVLNNSCLQRVIAQQPCVYGTDLYSPNFAKFAEACGAVGYNINDESEINNILNQALTAQKGPVVINVTCSPDWFAPTSPWRHQFNPDY